LSAYIGTTVRVCFDLTIPEIHTGPGFFQLDNVRMAALLPATYPITGTATSVTMTGATLNGIVNASGTSITADYDYGVLAFVNGSWNGAEALAGNDGTMPGPDGGSIWNYLSDSGTYLGPGDFGGSGPWNAEYQGDQ